MQTQFLHIENSEIDDGLEIAARQGEELYGMSFAPTFVCVGDVIEEENITELLKGHGIQSIDGKLVATVCGRLERINQLVSVRPLRARYTAEVGDVVIGRVVGILGGQWKVDINGRQNAVMGLTSVFLPGQVHRRQTAEDESTMRSVFRESDLMVAEVQTVRHDGGTNLHTRSEKYGKLEYGQLTMICASFVRRQRQHFHVLEDLGVTVIFGCNGFVWITPRGGKDGAVVPEIALNHVARLSSAVKVLDKLCLPIYLDTVLRVHNLSMETACEVQNMDLADFLNIVAQRVFLNQQK